MISSAAGAPSIRPIQHQASRSHQEEKVEVDASYTPAEIEIHTRNPEMRAHWDEVWTERGYLGPYAQMKEIVSIAQSEMVRNISERVQAGMRIRNLHKERGNVFGDIAFQKFLADRQAQIRLDAAPKYGVRIDVRIYPPEISVDTNIKGGTNTY